MKETNDVRRIGAKRTFSTVSAMVSLIVSAQVLAQAPPADEIDEVTIQGDRLNVLQNEPVDSVFGFGKSVRETPRALTTISNELLEKTIITEIDDIVALTPGSFTQSFFGVAGSLDIRGSQGDNFFRGVRRIANPGNYPTAIGASDRIDVVRGPSSPLYGPSQIGGYLNFVPKSARAKNGQYISENTGDVSIDVGSFDRKIVHGEIGGPTTLFGKPSGFFVYAESENSGSFYENGSTAQTIVQASMDMMLSDTWHTEFGGMYQYFKGNQVAGWNRLSQALINDGTYITGTPRSLDTNGNGLLNPAEANAANGGNSLFAFYPFWDPATTPDLALQNPGTTKLRMNQVLVQEDDNLEDDVTVLYLDLIGEFANGLKITNKMFFESVKNNNENAYGFSQMADTYAFEDQFNVAFSPNFGDSILANFQGGASVRYQDFEHGDNFDFEYFDRRDISVNTKISTPVDRRGMATRGQENYSQHTVGRFIDYGVALMADLTFFEKLNLVAGGRYDYLDMTSNVLADSNTFPGESFDDKDGALSWSGSLSYELPGGIRPYVTIAKQSTIVLGQGGQIPLDNLRNDGAIGGSKLHEYGIKASLLDGKLFAAVDYFEQERVDYSAQDPVTNNTTKSRGYEGELRWVVTDNITLTGAYTNLKIFNIGPAAEAQFSFMGAEDLIKAGIAPFSAYGGTVGWVIATPDRRKAGIPENIYSLNALLGLDPWVPGLSATVGVTSVDSVYSGYSKSVKLPGYTLLNTGLRYESGNWAANLAVKNVTDARYFRSNFPDLFGSSVVLPELPRTWLLSLHYKF